MPTEVLNWETHPGIPEEQFAEETASCSMETKRIPDQYCFIEDQAGDLYHPEGRTKVRNFIGRRNDVERLEYRAFEKLELWFKYRESGSALWVSPPSAGLYPTSKIIISEIVFSGSQKRLDNWAIILDYNGEKTLQLAQNLSRYSENRPFLNHLNEVRETPIFLDTKGADWLYVLQEVIPDPKLWEMVKSGFARRAKAKAVSYAAEIYRNLSRGTVGLMEGQKMMVRMFGGEQASCPPVSRNNASLVFFGSSSLLGGNSLETDQYGSLEFPCPKCKATNRRPWGGKLPNCQHCGAGVGC